LEEQLTYSNASITIIKQTKHSLYKDYGSMLYGYIREVVKDTAAAEQYLLEVFNELKAQDIDEITEQGANPFLYLQKSARKKMSSFINTIEDCPDEQEISAKKIIRGNKFIDMMGQEQRHVFCGVHYHGKTTAKLAAELNKPELIIRQLLRESFTIISNNRNDTTVHQ
jgi:DNA-directed RNA polymerase specialized sigma24 family protein